MAYKLAFNGYDMSALTLRPDGGDRQTDLGEQELPRADGSVVQGTRRKSRPITVRGELTAATADALEATLQAMRAALLPTTQEQPLFFGRDDRYFMAQVVSFGESYNQGLTFGLLALVTVGFVSSQPDAYGTAPVTTALTTGAQALANPGTAATLPAWTVTIGQAGSGPITLSNATTLESCTLVPVSGSFSAGDVLVLTRSGYTVTQNGAAAFGLLGGRIPRLLPGANTVSLTAGGTATVGSASVTYTPRYA